MKRNKSLQARLKNSSCSCKIKGVDTPCRIWGGYTQKDGYPTIKEGYGRMNIQREGRSLKFPVHRVSKVLDEILTVDPDFDFYHEDSKKLFFELYDAYSLCGLSIDHLCRNSLCFAPLHLEWVYLSANQKRKKWSSQKRIFRMRLVSEGKTRHYTLVRDSNTIQALIKKIKRKQYRTVT